MRHEFSAGAVVYALLNNNTYFLVLQHTKNGHWDLPKGHLEKNETNQEAAIREVKEETGIDVTLDEGFHTSIEYYFTDKDGITVFKKVVFFMAQTQKQSVTLTEHQDYAWLIFEDAIKKVTFPTAKEVLTKAYQNLTHRQ